MDADAVVAKKAKEAEKRRLKKKRQKAKKKALAAQTAANGGVAPITAVQPAKRQEQTEDLSVPVDDMYSRSEFPKGMILEYGKSLAQHDAQVQREERAAALEDTDRLYALRKAAEVHRQVRAYARRHAKPGIKLFDYVEDVDAKAFHLIGASGLDAGLAFPTGLSLNHCAAHYTPNGGDKTVLQYDDVMKFDMGTHVNGHIIDSAMTIHFNPRWDKLSEASREATNRGVELAGPDVPLCDLGDAIHEIIESYEVEEDGNMVPLKPVANLSGHMIGQYTIHAGKSVPIARGGDSTRMQEGELYAVETFATSGKGWVHDDMDCSHYMLRAEALDSYPTLRLGSAKKLLGHIKKNFSTLAFCRRWLDNQGQKRHLLALKNLIENGLVTPYPPLCDTQGSHVSQHEHTFLLRPGKKEIFSKGDDGAGSCSFNQGTTEPQLSQKSFMRPPCLQGNDPRPILILINSSLFPEDMMGPVGTIIILSALGGIVFGYNFGVVNGVNSIFKHSKYGWKAIQNELFTTAIIVGACIGSTISGNLADRFGRRKTIVGSSILSAVFCMFLGIYNFPLLCLTRTAVGVGVGIQSAIVPMLAGEIAPPESRGFIATLYQIFICFGILVSYLANYTLKDSWQTQLVLGVVPSLLIILQSLVRMDESPSWLIRKKRRSEAEAILVLSYKTRERAQEAIQLIDDGFNKETESQATWGEIVTVWKRAFWIGTVLGLAQQLTGINTLIQYSTSIFEMAKFDNPLLGTVGVGAWNLMSTLVAAFFVDKLGRRPLLITGMGGIAMANVIVALGFKNGNIPMLVAGVILFIFSFEIGPGPLFYVVVCEIFPYRIKGRMMSYSLAVQWACNLLISVTFLTLARAIGRSATFAIYGVIALIATFLIHVLLPETKGRDLTMITDLMRSGGSGVSEGSINVSVSDEAPLLLGNSEAGVHRRGSRGKGGSPDSDSNPGSYQNSEDEA